MIPNLSSKNLIQTHSKNHFENMENGFVKIHTSIKRQLVNKSNSVKDDILALYVMISDLERLQNQYYQEFKIPETTALFERQLEPYFEKRSIYYHALNMLSSIHKNYEFENCFKKDQYYEGIERFLLPSASVSPGYKLLFELKGFSEPKGMIVNINQTVSYQELINQVWRFLSGEEEAPKFEDAIQDVRINLQSDQGIDGIQNDYPELYVVESEELFKNN